MCLTSQRDFIAPLHLAVREDVFEFVGSRHQYIRARVRNNSYIASQESRAEPLDKRARWAALVAHWKGWGSRQVLVKPSARKGCDRHTASLGWFCVV